MIEEKTIKRNKSKTKYKKRQKKCYKKGRLKDRKRAIEKDLLVNDENEQGDKNKLGDKV
ncbi:MAG: hypothetical protein ACERKV_11295 [Clostridiaceae bacterium]